MFTGIIEEIGKIKSISDKTITISCKKVLEDTKIGDSISVDGVCLTVSKMGNSEFHADISPETLRVTSLASKEQRSEVNLERALTLSSRLGGHIVSGHIDTIGNVIKLDKNGEFYELTISFDKQYSKYVAKKGAITINGTSLTVAECGKDFVTIALIPSTFDMTTIKNLKAGCNVNIEFDILSKYVEKFLSSSDNNNITVNFLAENGFC